MVEKPFSRPRRHHNTHLFKGWWNPFGCCHLKMCVGVCRFPHTFLPHITTQSRHSLYENESHDDSAAKRTKQDQTQNTSWSTKTRPQKGSYSTNFSIITKVVNPFGLLQKHFSKFRQHLFSSSLVTHNGLVITSKAKTELIASLSSTNSRVSPPAHFSFHLSILLLVFHVAIIKFLLAT